ncbi:hypothetical protein BDB01DRAFT_249035 [Pilobolus umbonatus]|nr:hypothetical protein BDB01DRAFT_249035 [Pilobolus umbonatus]
MTLLRTTLLSASRVANRNSMRLAVQPRFLSTPPPNKDTKEEIPKPEKYGVFREPPSALGLAELPELDKNTWMERKKQKLKDLANFDKAFAAHAAERRYL